MTVKELIDILEEYTYTNPERENHTVKMVGYDPCGERNYNIDITGIIADYENKTIHLWD